MPYISPGSPLVVVSALLIWGVVWLIVSTLSRTGELVVATVGQALSIWLTHTRGGDILYLTGVKVYWDCCGLGPCPCLLILSTLVAVCFCVASVCCVLVACVCVAVYCVGSAVQLPLFLREWVVTY